MPFLRDDNLTFHRFTTNVSSLDSSRRPSNEPPFADSSAADLLHSTTVAEAHAAAATTPSTMTSGPFARHHHTAAKAELSSNFAPVWTIANNSTATTSAAAAATTQPAAIHDPPIYKNSYTMESHDFQYLASSSRADSVTTTDRRKSMQNGSTAKLMLTDDDQANKQVSPRGRNVCVGTTLECFRRSTYRWEESKFPFVSNIEFLTQLSRIIAYLRC